MPHQMGKAVWPVDATYKITVRATLKQLDEWSRHKGKLEAALFLARAGDFLVKYQDELVKKAERREARLKKKREREAAACRPSE